MREGLAPSEAKVRDLDLLQRMADAKGLAAEFTYRQCVIEQERRDQLATLPAGSRRRAELRKQMEEQGAAQREQLRHIHSVLAICSLPYTAQPLHVREWLSPLTVFEGGARFG